MRAIVFLSSVGVALIVLRRLRFDRRTMAIVVAGVALYADYLTYTGVADRNYDGRSHLEYIQAIAEHLRLPAMSSCLACGHPPLYYALGAAWSRSVLAGGWMPMELGLQWLSLLLFVGFLVLAALVIRSVGASRPTRWLAMALVVFWPSSVLNSVRVHNDALASPLILAAIYFTARWDREQSPRDFWLALGASALAILTKATGYVAAATFILFALVHLRTAAAFRRDVTRTAVAVVVLAAVAGLAVFSRLERSPHTLCQEVLGHACDRRYVPPVPDTPSHFILFDLPDFIRRMDAIPEYPKPDYFWNRFAKSSLFGVLPLGDPLQAARHVALAVVIKILLLVMVSACLCGVVLLRPLPWRRYRVYVCAVASMLIFLVAFRIWVPNEFHEDFRHVFAILVPFCLAYALVVERARRVSGALYWTGVGVALLMIGSSVAFFARLP
ncbi:MAG TPA: phospholipid carrier-dependent glycosyltransferase [Polyangia bacterium]|nr:phospholipid carrier-dependent glycosyltransferase [Polyangia bacterium]